jgi:TolB-like protein
MLYRPGVVLVFAGVVAVVVLAWAAGGPVTRPSVAVRFEYQGNDSADEARIADGMAIEITRLLAQIDGLDVRPVVPASRYGDARRDTRTFGVGRGGELVLKGLVLSDGGVVRYINVSLVSVARWTVLWSGSFTPENNDIFTIHGRIVAAVAEALELRFLSGQRRYSLSGSADLVPARARFASQRRESRSA